jgi:hypothetical protein
MTQQKKKLAEKAVKLKYNSLLRGLADTLTIAETENKTLPLLGFPCGYNNTEPTISLKNADHDELGAFLDQDADGTAIEFNNLQEMIKNVNNYVHTLNEAIEAENERRQEIQLQAKQCRNQVLTRLRHERDNRILEVAFGGEGDEMMDFLKSLPTAETIGQHFASVGYQLAAKLEESTGIGDKNPTHMFDSAPEQIT